MEAKSEHSINIEPKQTKQSESEKLIISEPKPESERSLKQVCEIPKETQNEQQNEPESEQSLKPETEQAKEAQHDHPKEAEKEQKQMLIDHRLKQLRNQNDQLIQSMKKIIKINEVTNLEGGKNKDPKSMEWDPKSAKTRQERKKLTEENLRQLRLEYEALNCTLRNIMN